jgi:N4-(beta-N-acetylglucosaminyl)-L-asparaginase
MATRKEFLIKSSLALGAALIGAKSKAVILSSAGKETSPEGEGRHPLVIATWNNLGATDAAWEMMHKGGNALDGVEAGVRVPEADPANDSVGYGGLPDRDGHVTLDACIMDKDGRAGSVTFLEHIMHPISVARLVMEKTPHVLIMDSKKKIFLLKNPRRLGRNGKRRRSMSPL